MSEPISLTPQAALCLDSLRNGIDRKASIALATGLRLPEARHALSQLEVLGLVTTESGRRWLLTPEGARARVTVAMSGRRRRATDGAQRPGQGAARLLACLDRPRRGHELATLLGVTRQRIHQLVVKLAAQGLIRWADATYPTFAVARQSDPTVLLRREQERVLSAFPDDAATTVSRIAAATHTPVVRVAGIVAALCETGLVQPAGTSANGDLYALSAAGASHWQRSAGARQASAPPPPFRSDRVLDVLTQLAQEGPTRTRDIGLALNIPKQSMNALMQYLKRRKAVRTQTEARFAPYELTPAGHEILAAMTRERLDRDIAGLLQVGSVKVSARDVSTAA